MLRPSSTVPVVLLLVASSAGAQVFQRDAAALDSPHTWTNGVATGDFDADGDIDLAFANGFDYGPGGARPQRLYLNDGSGVFSDASAQLDVADFNAQMVIAEDAENDGDLDLVYAPAGAFPATTQRARILINDGTGVFADESNARMPSTTMSSWCVVAADLDNDGDRELVFNDGCLTFLGQPGQTRLFDNDGAGFYTDVTASQGVVELYNGQDIVAFDYDGDFDLDLALSGFGTPGKRSSLWLNDGTGHFSLDPTLDQLCTANSYEVDWSDLDGDGDWDAAVQSISGAGFGSDEGWGENRGLGTPPPETTFSGANGDDDNELASFDYDMDGDLDVFVGSLNANREKIYRNDGGGLFNRVNLFQAITDSTLDMTFGDFDGDGRHDVVTAQGESGVQTNKIYDNVTGPVDTRAPRILAAEAPVSVGASETIFRIHVQDDWVDDGLTPVEVGYTWTTYAGGVAQASHSGSAGFMGGAMYRVAVPSGGGVEGIELQWQVSDTSGNAAAPLDLVVGDVGGDVWADLGLGLAGTGGVPPLLTGSGPLTPLSGNLLALSGAPANDVVHLVLGLSRIDAAFKGGTLVPALDLVIFGLPTDASGELALPFSWPSGVPAGVDVFFQDWAPDLGGPAGFAASNGLRGRAQD